MSSEWPTLTLRELTINHDTKRKPVKGPDRKAGPYPYYGASGIVDYVDGFLFDGDYLLIAEDGENLKTRQTPIAFMAKGKFWVNNHAHIVTGNELADTRFLMYALLQADVHSFLTGAVMPKLTQGNLNNIPIACPPREIQERIVGILGGLDDRIALLRETNTTLEAIAQALFKSWFVDFDPVHAKQQGREPEGMDAATAALFPNSFEESELGLVPTGWQTGTLADLAELNPESWTTKSHPKTLHYIDLANAKNNEIDVITEYVFDDAPSRARRVLRTGDSIVGTVRPGNRSFAYIYQAANNLTGSTGFATLRPKNIVTAEFLFIAATQDANIEHLAHVADGGAYPAVRPEVVVNIRTILPEKNVMVSFHDVVAPIFARVGKNKMQAQALAILRDTLLPRLISGQLRLPETEAMVEEVSV